MLRGFKTFKCPKCGHVFKAPDIELNATIELVPMFCPMCGCKDCKPASTIDRMMGIWFQDNNRSNQ